MSRATGAVLMAGLAAGLALAGCAEGPFARASKPAAEAGARAAPPRPAGAARTAEQYDTTSAEERQAAAAAPSGGGGKELGRTIASLGDPTDPGFWAVTPLVQSARAGRLVYPGNGRSVQVELRPSAGEPGSGTRVSLPAFRVLEAPLTGLPELIVYEGSAG